MYFIQQNTFAQQLLQGLPFLDLTTLGLGASSKQTFCGLFFLPSSGKASLAPKVVRIEDSQQATAAAYKARVIKARKSKSQIGLISSGPFWCLFVGESLIRKKKNKKRQGSDCNRHLQ